MSFEVWQAGDVSLYRGDCLEVLPTLATGSVDAVVTDPPYGIGYQSAWRIDTSERFPVLAGDVELSLGWIAGLPRLLRAPAPVFCFCRWDTQELFRQALGESFAVRSHVVWDRGVHGLGDMKAQYAPCHDLAWFSTWGHYAFPHGRPKSVYRVDRVEAGSLVHPTQKPIALMRWIIGDLTRAGDTVIDPFMGSGTTGVACVQTGRKFIGIEIDPAYLGIARKRIEAAQQQLRLPMPEESDNG